MAQRRAALAAFGKMDPAAQQAMTPRLVRLLREGPWPAQWTVARALEAMGARAAARSADLRAWLTAAARKRSPGEIGLAARLLHCCAPDAIADARGPLLECLKHDDPEIVRHACIAVERLGPRLAALRGALERTAEARKADEWFSAHVRKALEALTRDSDWMPLPLQGVRPTTLDYADHGGAKKEKVRDEHW
jgi:hypothetical protein